ncbi:exocyst complex component Sec10 [Rhizodiscina lignyota]|uniref:Exocyst complex component Sec10 n=1 Tax=Rhizodiscina lignyota TaxID=1504668 RepID=A0A9P4MBN0_9PEZI|nr:exocyst complex component Sec10 [Rhizodiscina lignyota]
MPPSGADGAAASGRTLFARGAPTFDLETFSSKDFIVKDFIEALSDSAVPASRRSGPSSAQSAFDPKPLIRTFEAAVSRLGALSEELETHENELSGSVRRAEAQHNQNVASLEKKLEGAIESFNRLDSSLNGGVVDGSDGDAGGNVAMRIGERLEELDKQRQRAQDAKFLIQCWVEVSEKGRLSTLEDVRRIGGSEGKVRCAHIARQLLRLSARLDSGPSPAVNGAARNGANGVNGVSSSKHPTREIIEKFLEQLEKDLLKEFDDHYRKANFEAMKECAVALRDFNDGASVMALFVNQHQFFIDRSQLITEEITGDNESWERLADPDAEPPGVEPSLQSLVDEVRLVVQEESFIIKRAFPYYDEVLQRFLQRVFQQSVQQRLEMVLEKANSISSLAFLRSLHSARSYINTLVEELKAHGLTEHPEPVSSQIAATLDQQLDELFVPYFVGSSYIEREKRNLEELYSSLLFKFTTYHSRRRKMPTTMIAALSQRSREMMASARDAYIDRLDSTDLPASQKAMLLRVAGLKDADNEKKAEIEVSEEDGALSLSNAKRMLKWLAEGVGRGLELSSSTDTPKDAQALLGLLLSSMGEIYVETALDATAEVALAQESARNEPDLSYLPPLRNAISILHILQTSITTMLIPLAKPNLTIRREIDKATAASLSALETKISIILNRALDAALAWTAKLLQSQKKTDFRPREEDLGKMVETLQTPTCLSIFQFLSKVAGYTSAALDGANMSHFLAELAMGLRGLLLEHLRKFTVSLAGGLIVSKDVTKYVELVRGWPIGTRGDSSSSMEVLVEVANLFVVGPEALREKLKPVPGGSGQGGRSAEEVAELREFVKRREDLGSVGMQAVLSSV